MSLARERRGPGQAGPVDAVRAAPRHLAFELVATGLPGAVVALGSDGKLVQTTVSGERTEEPLREERAWARALLEHFGIARAAPR